MGRSTLDGVLDWDDLRVFLAVARAGSLSAAARELGVTQPTVGRRIAAFERRLGAELFVPTPTGQALAPTGRLLLGHAQRMEIDAVAAERIASGRDAGLRGRVRITASEWLIGSVIGPLLGAFVERHTELELELFADVRNLNLVRQEANIAIRPSRFEHQDIVERQIGVAAYGLYASDAYLAEHGMPDFSRACEGHRLIALCESMRKIPDIDWLLAFAEKSRVAVRTNGREAMARMAAAGVGMACLPRFIGDRTAGLRLLPAPAPRPERSLWLGYHRDARSVPRLRASVDFLATSIERLRPALCPPA